mmetsp:Transcript_6166/g.15200  ORF Transcript_6166/g.15200 Transcript_6166/m.15200 type:complete len:200 (+) Transcript_6166:4889-5488(+)
MEQHDENIVVCHQDNPYHHLFLFVAVLLFLKFHDDDTSQDVSMEEYRDSDCFERVTHNIRVLLSPNRTDQTFPQRKKRKYHVGAMDTRYLSENKREQVQSIRSFLSVRSFVRSFVCLFYLTSKITFKRTDFLPCLFWKPLDHDASPRFPQEKRGTKQKSMNPPQKRKKIREKKRRKREKKGVSTIPKYAVSPVPLCPSE